MLRNYDKVILGLGIFLILSGIVIFYLSYIIVIPILPHDVYWLTALVCTVLLGVITFCSGIGMIKDSRLEY